MTGDPYVQRNRLHYGRTFVSAPSQPRQQTLTRVVGGAPLVYVRRGDVVRVYDGQKQLPISPETARRIIAAWPDDDNETGDPIDWWGE